jgi:hypothetical protein
MPGSRPATPSRDNRLLKMVASFVLASLKASTYQTAYVLAFRSLRPCWTTILNSRHLLVSQTALKGVRHSGVD